MATINFTWPDKSKLSQGAFDIVKKLREAGHEALIAGGAVRDALLKRPIKEIDIATAATPAQVKKLFARTIPTGEKHGTVMVVHPLLNPPHKGEGTNRASFPPLDGEDKGGVNRLSYEVTTFRSEGPYLDSRRPSKVKFVKDAEEDAKRRDFTVNALFYNSQKKEVIDYASGLPDLKKKIIRLAGDPAARIREDALRMLRAVRIATELKFDIDKETRRAIQKNAGLIKNISAERVKQELDRIILSDRAAIGLGVLDVMGLLEHISPELKNCQGVQQPKNQHSEGDVYAHSLLALEQVKEDYDLATRYGVLFHDLGKAETRVVRAGRATFYNHPQVGEEIVKNICKRLKFSREDSRKIEWLVRYHMVPFDFPGMKIGTRRKWAISPYFRDLLRVYLADVKASIPARGGRARPRGLKQAIAVLRELDSKPELSKPLISGNDVMRILRLEPGPQVGKILREIDSLKLEGRLKTKEQALIYLRKQKRRT